MKVFTLEDLQISESQVARVKSRRARIKSPEPRQRGQTTNSTYLTRNRVECDPGGLLLGPKLGNGGDKI